MSQFNDFLSKFNLPEAFAKVLSIKICSTNYQESENTLILSKTKDEQPIYGASNDDYRERIKKVQDTGIMTLYMHNRVDIGIIDDVFYFVHLPGYPEGEIWRSEKVKRNLNQLLREHPDATLSSLIIVQ